MSVAPVVTRSSILIILTENNNGIFRGGRALLGAWKAQQGVMILVGAPTKGRPGVCIVHCRRLNCVALLQQKVP
jgi:hypothetical protein